MTDIAVNTDMSIASDKVNCKHEVNEKSAESDFRDNSYTGERTLSNLNKKGTSVAIETYSFKNQFHENQEHIAVKTEIDIETNIDYGTQHVLSVFPFVCGICDLKVNSISTYLTHFQVHEHIYKYLHCCFENERATNSNSADLYMCGACGLKYPSLCTLYKHLVSDEGALDFEFHGGERTAYVSYNRSNHQGNSDIYETDGNMVKVRSDKGTYNKVETSEDNETHKELTVKTEVATVTKGTEERERKTNRKVSKIPNLDNNKRRKSRKRVYNTHKTVVKIESRPGEFALQQKVKNEIQIEKVCNIQETDNHKYSDSDSAVMKEAENRHRERNIGEKSYTEIDTECLSSKVKQGGRLNKADFPCETCGKMLRYRSLKAHRAIHEKHIFPCDICDLKFHRKELMQTHKAQVHATDKKFICDECGKGFKALAYLRQHSQTHRKQRNFKCPVCAKMFLYKGLLRVHLTIHSDKRPHRCNICGKGFKRHHDVVVHKEGVHEAVEKYPCTECDKKFMTKDRLRKHKTIHQPPKFSCQFCGKTFVQHFNMIIHLKVHREFKWDC